MLSRLLVAALLTTCALGGCAQHPPLAVFDEASTPYRLASGDKLRIIVFGQDNLSNVYAVDGGGRISLPLIGEVAAQGQTTQGLERQIESKLRGGFLREPKVSVEIDAYRPFYILGEVNQAGQYPYVNNITVQAAVAIAGGFTPRGAQSYAEVTRVVQGKPVAATVPISQVLRPGDTVVIRERFF